MVMFFWSVLAFSLPLGVFALLAALLGFLWRPAFASMLAVGALAVLWLCSALAAGDGFAPLLIFPLVLASVIAMAGGTWLLATLEAGFRQEAVRPDDGRDR